MLTIWPGPAIAALTGLPNLAFDRDA